MTKEELENYQEKVENGTVLSLKVRAAGELVVTINRLRFAKDMKGLLEKEIKNLILRNTADCDDIYFTDNRFAKDVLEEINIDAITNETLKNILELVKAKKPSWKKNLKTIKFKTLSIIRAGLFLWK